MRVGQLCGHVGWLCAVGRRRSGGTTYWYAPRAVWQSDSLYKDPCHGQGAATLNPIWVLGERGGGSADFFHIWFISRELAERRARKGRLPPPQLKNLFALFL